MQKINIEFTKVQFLELMRLIHIWEMAVNWHKINDFDKKAEDLQKFIVKQAVKNNIKDYLHKYEWIEEYWLEGGYDIDNDKSMEFFEELSDYCEHSFYEDLVEILSKNMMFDKYSHNKIEEMGEWEYDSKLSEFVDKIENELNNNDYDNLTLKFINPIFNKQWK